MKIGIVNRGMVGTTFANNNKAKNNSNSLMPDGKNAQMRLANYQQSVAFGMARLSPQGLEKIVDIEAINPLKKTILQNLSSFTQNKNVKHLEELVDNLTNTKTKNVGKGIIFIKNKENETVFELLLKYEPNLAKKYLNFIEKQDADIQKTFALFKNGDGNSYFNIALREDQPKVAEKYLEFIEKQDADTQKTFALFKDCSGNSHFNFALHRNQPEVAEKYLNFIEKQDADTQKTFALFKNGDGNSYFNLALYYGQTKVAEKYLNFVLKSNPELIGGFKIKDLPDVYLINAGEIIATCENLSKQDTLLVLRRNNRNDILDDLINIVEENAIG